MQKTQDEIFGYFHNLVQPRRAIVPNNENVHYRNLDHFFLPRVLQEDEYQTSFTLKNRYLILLPGRKPIENPHIDGMDVDSSEESSDSESDSQSQEIEESKSQSEPDDSEIEEQKEENKEELEEDDSESESDLPYQAENIVSWNVCVCLLKKNNMKKKSLFS